jgi:DNA (cytosine-5)-methyltransferase 3A
MDPIFAELPTEQKLVEYPFILNKSGYKGKSRVLNKTEYDFPNGCYRLLSVLESERLMTFPDGYISEVPNISKTEKLKLVGLSFTCDVITHLLSSLNK